MNHNLAIQRLRFETLEVKVHEETRTVETSLIQERSTTAVKAYKFDFEKKDKFALLIEFTYNGYEISDPKQPRELTVLNGSVSAFFETDAFQDWDSDKESAEQFLREALLYEAQVLYETAIHIKLKDILADFGIRSNLSLGRITATPITDG